MKVCSNCQYTCSDQDNFCPACGQDTRKVNSPSNRNTPLIWIISTAFGVVILFLLVQNVSQDQSFNETRNEVEQSRLDSWLENDSSTYTLESEDVYLFDNLVFSSIETYDLKSDVFSQWTGIRGKVQNLNDVRIHGYINVIFYSGSSIVDTRLVYISPTAPNGSTVFETDFATEARFTSYEIQDSSIFEDY